MTHFKRLLKQFTTVFLVWRSNIHNLYIVAECGAIKTLGSVDTAGDNEQIMITKRAAQPKQQPSQYWL